MTFKKNEQQRPKRRDMQMTTKENEWLSVENCLQKAFKNGCLGVFGVGVDIEEIDRFRKNAFEENQGFYEKVFSQAEIKYCLGMPFPHQHFAARFCAKEAFVKAFGKKVPLKNIEVLNGGCAPKLRVKGLKGFEAMVSLSHSMAYAIAFVVLGKEEKGAWEEKKSNSTAIKEN